MPAEGSVMCNRPLGHNLMKQDAYFDQYHRYLDELISNTLKAAGLKYNCIRRPGCSPRMFKIIPRLRLLAVGAGAGFFAMRSERARAANG